MLVGLAAATGGWEVDSAGQSPATQTVAITPPSHLVAPSIEPGPLWDAPPAWDAGLPADGLGVESLLAPGTEMGTPPLSSSWLDPRTFLRKGDWKNSLEVGLNGAGGSSQAVSIRAGYNLARTAELTDWNLSFMFTKNEANGIMTQHNALTYSNWNWHLDNLDHPRWSLFTKNGLEYDQFQPFDLRFFLNSGLGYDLLEIEDITKLRTRFGSGASREFGGPVDDWQPEANFGFDFNHQLTKLQKINATVDYFPAWDNWANYRSVGNFGWEVVVDQEDNISFKVNVIDRYDSTPNGVRPNEVNYSVLLIWTL